MSLESQIDVQDLDHLGIIAGIVDDIGIVEIIDRELGKHPQEKVSAGQAVKAMILNCMGFLTSPLYLFSEFFAGKATEHLIGEGVTAEHLNESRLGRVMDQLYSFPSQRIGKGTKEKMCFKVFDICSEFIKILTSFSFSAISAMVVFAGK